MGALFRIQLLAGLSDYDYDNDNDNEKDEQAGTLFRVQLLAGLGSPSLSVER